MGSIETLPSGNFRAYAWNSVAQEKEPVKPERGRSFKSWADADAAVRRREAELDGTYLAAGVPVQRQQPAAEKIGFTEFAWQWHKEAGGELATRNSRATKIRLLIKTFGKFDSISDIHDRHVREWWAGQERNYAPTSRVCTLSTLNKLVKAAVKAGYRTDNPVTELQEEQGDLTERVRQRTYIEDQELYYRLYFLPARMWPAVLLAYDCGLRVAEVAGLRWMRVDFDKGVVVVKDVREADGRLRPYPKGKKHRVIPMTERVVDALRVLEAKGVEPEDFVFLNAWGKPISAETLGSNWRDGQNKAGISKIKRCTFHDLRHNTGNNLARDGAEAPTIQRVLGHAQLSTSQTYIDDIDIEAARAAMNGAVKRRTANVTRLPRGKRKRVRRTQEYRKAG